MRALILCGGEVYDYASIRVCRGDFIICADAGAKHILPLGVKPDVYLGDFDSCDVHDRGIPIVKFKKEKDETDTFLAAEYAIKKGYNEIVIIGALGGRADHSAANVFLLKYLLQKGVKAFLEDGKNTVFMTQTDVNIAEKGVYVSLFPVFGDVEELSVSGMKYPLSDYFMKAGDMLGISNEVSGECGKISFKSGTLMVILCRD